VRAVGSDHVARPDREGRAVDRALDDLPVALGAHGVHPAPSPHRSLELGQPLDQQGLGGALRHAEPVRERGGQLGEAHPDEHAPAVDHDDAVQPPSRVNQCLGHPELGQHLQARRVHQRRFRRAARLGPCVEHDVGNAQLGQPDRCGQPGRPRADDHDVGGLVQLGHRVLLRRWTVGAWGRVG
jgi:hypothetical protein